MAKLLLLLLLAFVAAIAAAQQPQQLYSFIQSENPSTQLHLPETLTHLRFYFHDITNGSNPTAVLVAQAASTNASPSSFGLVTMIDDPLTEAPELTSKLVGHAQGLYACASQEEMGLLMAMNLAFLDGKYNGSTLAVLGRNVVTSDVREMPIVGGSGLFRYARGYVQARTHSIKGSIIEYNAFVIHNGEPEDHVRPCSDCVA